MINRIILVGHLGKDPTCKKTATGKSMVTFSMATRDHSSDRDRTDWHSVVVWDKLADTLTGLATPRADGREALLRQGSLVYVEGSLRMEENVNRETGQKTYFTRVVAAKVDILNGVGRDGHARQR